MADPLPKRKRRSTGPLKSTKRPDTPAAQVPGSGVLVADPVGYREIQRTLYVNHLRTTLSNRGKKYSPDTISAYNTAVLSLAMYLTDLGFKLGFEAVGYEELNGYLGAYRESNDQGGTVTKQSNLRMFFAWLVDEYEVQNAYQHPKRHMYRRDEVAPEVLPEELIKDLLKVTSGRSFEDLRDNLIIRLFLVGPRSGELSKLTLPHLDIGRATVWFPPAKFASNPRPVPLAPATVTVAGRYLRARAVIAARPGHTQTDALFLSAKRGTALTKSGIAQMLKRRTEDAGWEPESVHPHLFRHTAADRWLAEGGSEGDAMSLMGWTDRSMLDRYGASNRQQRAVDAARLKRFGDY
jgi:site-specific recombinase XerD